MGTSLTEMLRPEPQPWTTEMDYIVIDCRGIIIVCPYSPNLRHVGYSNVFDFRMGRDAALHGYNRAKRYIGNSHG